MSFLDKARNKFQNLSGRGKETTGRATDNERLEAEGRGDQASASFKDAGEKAKDAVKDVKDGFTK